MRRKLRRANWLMVVKNNYYWTEQDAVKNRAGLAKDFTLPAAQNLAADALPTGAVVTASAKSQAVRAAT